MSDPTEKSPQSDLSLNILTEAASDLERHSTSSGSKYRSKSVDSFIDQNNQHHRDGSPSSSSSKKVSKSSLPTPKGQPILNHRNSTCAGQPSTLKSKLKSSSNKDYSGRMENSEVDPKPSSSNLKSTVVANPINNANSSVNVITSKIPPTPPIAGVLKKPRRAHFDEATLTSPNMVPKAPNPNGILSPSGKECLPILKTNTGSNNTSINEEQIMNTNPVQIEEEGMTSFQDFLDQQNDAISLSTGSRPASSSSNTSRKINSVLKTKSNDISPEEYNYWGWGF